VRPIYFGLVGNFVAVCDLLVRAQFDRVDCCYTTSRMIVRLTASCPSVYRRGFRPSTRRYIAPSHLARQLSHPSWTDVVHNNITLKIRRPVKHLPRVKVNRTARVMHTGVYNICPPVEVMIEIVPKAVQLLIVTKFWLICSQNVTKQTPLTSGIACR